MDRLSNCRFFPFIEGNGFFRDKGVFQKITLVLFLGLFLSQGDLFAQRNNRNVTGTNTENISGDYPISPEDFPNCPQNNVTAVEVIFRDINGDEIDPNNPPADQDPNQDGIQIIGQLAIVFGGSTSNAYSFYTQFDVIRNGDESSRETIVGCISQNANVVPGQEYLVGEFTWTFGELLEVENIFTRWRTGQANGQTCPATGGNAQCFSNFEGFTVTTPLVAQFDFISDCSLEVDFINGTTGGDTELPYFYSWDFDNDGLEDSNIENPTYIFPSAGNYTVTLTVTNDGFSISQTQDVIVNVTPEAPVLDVPAPDCDAEAVTITFTPEDGVEYALDENFENLIEGGSFTSNVDSQGTVYARTVDTDCVSEIDFEVDPAPVTPAAPILTVPAPDCDAETVTITFTPEDGVEYALDENFENLIAGGSFTADVDSQGTVYARTVDTDCVSEIGFEVDPAPVTPEAPVLSVPAPDCDAETVTITFTPEDGVEYALDENFENLIEGGSFTANVDSQGTVYARTVDTDCVSEIDFEVDPAPVTPAAPILTVPAPDCDAETVTITFTPEDGVEYALDENFENLIAGGSFTADVSSQGTVYSRTVDTECMSESPYEVAPAPQSPVAPISGGDEIECAEDEIQTLTATAEVGDNETLIWYTTENGDETTDSPTLSEVGTVTYYAAAINNTTQCESQERTPVTLTINNCSIALVKTVVADPSNEDNCLDTDDNLIYTFTVTNTGNVTIDNVSIKEESFSGTGSLSVIAFVSSSEGSSEGTLLEGETATYTANYTISAEDTQAGLISNQAEVTGTVGDYGNVSDLSGETIEDDEVTEIEICQDPSLDISKVIDVNDEELGGTLSYIITVINDGNVTLTNILVEDEQLDFEFLIESIDPGESVIFNSSEFEELTMTITSQMIEAGCFENTATAGSLVIEGENNPIPVQILIDGPQQPGVILISQFFIEPVSDTALACFNQNPAIAILKEAVEPADCITEGDEITYRFTVTNEGNVSLSNVEVTDNKVSDAAITGPLSGDAGEDGILGLEETWIYEVSYTVTSNDIDNGEVANTATVTAGFGQFNLSEDSNEVIVDVDKTTEISTQPEGVVYCIGQAATALAVVADGEGTLSYQWFVNNENSKEGAEEIEGADDESYLPSTAAAGTLYYFVVVTGECGELSSDIVSVEVVEVPVPELTVPAPECDATEVTITFTPEDGVEYSLDENFEILINSSSFVAEVDSQGTVYARAEGTECVVSIDYNVDPAPQTPEAPVLDVPAPECDATEVTITFTPEDGVEYSLNENFESLIEGGSFLADVDSQGTVYARTVDTECVSESPYEVAPAPVTPAAPVSGEIIQSDCEAPTGSIQIQTVEGVEYSINGGITYTSTGFFDDLGPATYTIIARFVGGECISEGLEVTLDPQPQTPGAPVLSEVVQPTCDVETGSIQINTIEGVEYSINGVDFTETGFFGNLSPNQYIIFARFVDSECISEGTIATINPQPVTPVAPIAEVAQPTCDVETGIITVTPIEGVTYSIDGQTYQISNVFAGVTPGNYTVTVQSAAGCVSAGTPVTVNAQPVTPEAPVANVTQPTCDVATGVITVTPIEGVTYSINGIDYQASNIFAGVTPGNYTVTVQSAAGCVSAGTPVTVNPQPVTPLAPVANVAQPTCDVATGVITVTPIEGVTYSINGIDYQASNIFAGVLPGNYSVTVQSAAGCVSAGTPTTVNPQPVTPEAPVSGGNQTECFFEAGQILTATATVGPGLEVVWYNAPEGGEVVNPILSSLGTVTYYAESLNPETGCVSSSRTPVTLTFNSCGVVIEKTSDVESVNLAGQTINYTLTVSNPGTADLSNVAVLDPLTGFNQVIPVLVAGATIQLETSYMVTQEDIDSGLITNTATATGFVGEVEVSDQDSAVVSAIQTPAIAIEITDNDAEITEAGQEIVYTITVTNTGNVTLENVTIVDSKTGLVINIGTLNPGESKSVNTDPYEVTQEDVDNGSVTNESTATGESPNQGDDNPTAEDEVTTPIAQLPGIAIVKTADKSEIREAGEVIVYTLTVTNTGNVGLSDVTVKDPLTGLEENIGSLAPGETATVETSYTVTEEDLENERLVNVASVTAQTPSEEEIGDEDELVVGVGANEIIANDDDFGSYFLSYGGLIGNILDNDLLKGERPDPADVDFEFTELDGIIGLLIDENGELSLIPEVNEIRDYTLQYVLREVVNPSNNDDALVFFRILNDQADLRITKEALQEEVFEGDLFDYELVVSNVGETDATNVVVTDNIPAGVTYQSYTVTANTSGSTVSATVSGNNVSFAIPFMGAGTSVTIQIRVKAGAAGRVLNTAIVGSDEDELNPDDNEDSDETVIEPFRIPNVITPNGDGRNDVFEIQGLGKYASNSITIFNRYGDHVLERENYGNDWDAPGQVAGTYFYVLRVTTAQGTTTEFKGWIQVIKE